MRVLILDGSALPIEPRQRRARLAEQFPRLSASEVDDLAEVPPDRLAVYTDLVFAGERAALRWAFPISFAVIAALTPTSPTCGGDDWELMRDLHRFRPWRSASSRELAQLFQAYLIEKRAGLIERWSGLAELVDY